MKLEANIFEAPRVRSTGPGYIVLADQRIAHHALLRSFGDRPVEPWHCAGFASLQALDFEAVLRPVQGLLPEVVIFGSGQVQRFLSPSLWQAVMAAGVGFEAMDTAAACRTYNVLAAEGRRVLAALLVE